MKSMVIFKFMMPFVMLHLSKGWELLITFCTIIFSTLSAGPTYCDQRSLRCDSFRYGIPTTVIAIFRTSYLSIYSYRVN